MKSFPTRKRDLSGLSYLRVCFTRDFEDNGLVSGKRLARVSPPSSPLSLRLLPLRNALPPSPSLLLANSPVSHPHKQHAAHTPGTAFFVARGNRRQSPSARETRLRDLSFPRQRDHAAIVPPARPDLSASHKAFAACLLCGWQPWVPTGTTIFWCVWVLTSP